ncbi:MAG: polysaccharide deacetylase family protein [Patescibacteria group bacterium]
MDKITWVNFLHIYQPPWQDRGVIEQVANQSYDYLLTLLAKYPKFSFTLNISGNLVEVLAAQHPDILARLKDAVASGRVELTASAYYHPLLPLLPKFEIIRQIELNQAILKKYFGKIKISGFYLPEMAYSLPVAKIIKQLGFQWIILDPIVYRGAVDNKILYKIKNLGLTVVFRNREISRSYPPEIIFHKLRSLKQSQLIITATDGEIYGHFHTDWQGHIEKILLDKNLQVLTATKYLSALKKSQNIDLRPASQASTEAELKKGIPYAMWSDPKNNIHINLWRLANLAIVLVGKSAKDKNITWARRHLDRGLSSCVWWWASAKKPSPFSALTWHPDMVDQGADDLVRSIRSLGSASSKDKIRAEEICLDIKRHLWLDHWRKYYKNN